MENFFFCIVFFNPFHAISANSFHRKRRAQNQFHYTPLVWMFADKSLISKGKDFHFQSLQLVHNMYETILSINNYVPIHQKHIFLVHETFKSVNKSNPQFTRSYFRINYFPYDLRKGILCFYLRYIQPKMKQICSYSENHKDSPLKNLRND